MELESVLLTDLHIKSMKYHSTYQVMFFKLQVQNVWQIVIYKTEVTFFFLIVDKKHRMWFWMEHYGGYENCNSVQRNHFQVSETRLISDLHVFMKHLIKTHHPVLKDRKTLRISLFLILWSQCFSSLNNNCMWFCGVGLGDGARLFCPLRKRLKRSDFFRSFVMWRFSVLCVLYLMNVLFSWCITPHLTV